MLGSLCFSDVRKKPPPWLTLKLSGPVEAYFRDIADAPAGDPDADA